MKVKKLICFLAFPLMLVAWVGCSKDNAEEKKTDNVKVEDYKKTDSVQDADSEDKKDSKTVELRDKDFMKTVDEEIDKAQEEESVNKKETGEDSKEVASKEKSKTDRTLAEERASEDKQVIREVNPPITLKQYQENIDETAKEVAKELQATKPIFAKDETLKENQVELKQQLGIFKEKLDKLTAIEPPKDYDYYRTQLRDDVKVIKQSIDQVFVGLDENDIEKAEANLGAMFGYIDTMGSTLNEIRDAQN